MCSFPGLGVGRGAVQLHRWSQALPTSCVGEGAYLRPGVCATPRAPREMEEDEGSTVWVEVSGEGYDDLAMTSGQACPREPPGSREGVGGVGDQRRCSTQTVIWGRGGERRLGGQGTGWSRVCDGSYKAGAQPCGPRPAGRCGRGLRRGGAVAPGKGPSTCRMQSRRQRRHSEKPGSCLLGREVSTGCKHQEVNVLGSF